MALALAVMPLQGLTATFSVLACLNGEDGHVSHAMPQHGDHDPGVAHDHSKDHSSTGSNGASDNHANHFCCHHVVSGLPLNVISVVAKEFSVQAVAIQSLHDLFLPDRPQRPPLA